MDNFWTDELLAEFVEQFIGYNAHGIVADFKKKKLAERSKTWEILSFNSKNGEYHKVNGEDSYTSPNQSKIWLDMFLNGSGGLLKDSISILTVRRLYDNEIFTIGDKITFGKEKEIYTILRFDLEQNQILLYVGNSLRLGLTFVHRHEKLILTTEDGEKITDQNKVLYKVKKEDLSLCGVCLAYIYSKFEEKYFLFSTQEAALKFIAKNKHLVSYKDILRVLEKMPKRGNKENPHVSERLLRERLSNFCELRASTGTVDKELESLFFKVGMDLSFLEFAMLNSDKS